MKSKKSFLKVNQLRQLLADFKIDTLLIDRPIDLFYLTGVDLSFGKLLISKKSTIFLVDGRYIQVCKENAPVEVELFSEKLFSTLLEKAGKVGFDSYSTSYHNFVALSKLTNKLVAIERPLKFLRAIKRADEIAKIQENTDLVERGLFELPKFVEEGMTERDLALKLEVFWKMEGARELAFSTIIAFGENSAKPHHIPGDRKLKKGDPILVDCGVDLNYYKSDTTRVFFFGKPTLKLLKIKEVVERAQEAALSLCKPFAKLGDLDAAARAVLKKAKLEKYFIHSLGHGVGLEIHEFPQINSRPENRDYELQAGMVITIEPGVYIEGLGGIRHEDTIVITKTGYKKFLKNKLYDII